MSNLEIELLASRPCTPSSPNTDGLTLFPQPTRRNQAKVAPRPWRNDAERNAWLDAYNPNDDSESPKDFRHVSLDEL